VQDTSIIFGLILDWDPLKSSGMRKYFIHVCNNGRFSTLTYWTLPDALSILDINDVSAVGSTPTFRWMALIILDPLLPLILKIKMEQQSCQYKDNHSPEDGSGANSWNVVYTEYTSDNWKSPT